jgi:hypothetical protein
MIYPVLSKAAFVSFLALPLSALPLLASTGCAAGADPILNEPVGTSEEAVVSTNRLSMNRLSMNRLSMNGLSMSRLSPDGLNLAATDLLLDDAGRELLRYVVRCALPEGQTLVGTSGSTTYTFDGLIGLAPNWLYRSLTESEQRWVSACLLAHVNGYGVEVSVSLRGNNPTLVTNDDERVAYRTEEVSFFGNVFMPVGRGDELGDIGNRMYSCGGASLQQACGAIAFGPTRTCALNPDCEIEFLGACQNATLPRADVCRRVSFDDSYIVCHTAQRGTDGKWPKGPTYNEVITVYLRPIDFSGIYPSCVF